MIKKELRDKYKKLRDELTPKVLADQSVEVSNRLFKHVDLENKKVHVFLPITSKKEINTWLIIDRLRSVAEVVVSISDFNSNTMKHVLLNDNTQFKESDYGIPEPFGNNLVEVAPNEIDVVLLPLLGFDKKGYRVGYGKGFYDRFLINLNEDALKVGLSLFGVEDDFISDINSNDIPMDICVTPEILYTFNGN